MDKDRLFLLNRLMSMYGNMIKEMCNLFLRDQPTLGDCAARTVFVCVWNELSGIPDVSHEKAWLRCIAIDVCHTYVHGAKLYTKEELHHWHIPSSLIYKYYRVARTLKSRALRYFSKEHTNNAHGHLLRSGDALRDMVKASQKNINNRFQWTSADSQAVHDRILARFH